MTRALDSASQATGRLQSRKVWLRVSLLGHTNWNSMASSTLEISHPDTFDVTEREYLDQQLAAWVRLPVAIHRKMELFCKVLYTTVISTGKRL